MKCFEIDHLGMVVEGILVTMKPGPHIPLGKILGQEGKAVPIDRALAKTIVWDPTYGRGYDSRAGRYKTVLKSECHWLKAAGVSADGSTLIAPASGEDEGIIVCWRLLSGWGGAVTIDLGHGAEEIARASRRLSEAETDMTRLDILAVLRPGGSIVMSLTGETLGGRFGELSYAGGDSPPAARLDKR